MPDTKRLEDLEVKCKYQEHINNEIEKISITVDLEEYCSKTKSASG